MAASTAVTHQSLVLNLLSNQLILTEGVTGFSCDGINRTFLHLLLDGTVEHEEWLSSTFLPNETDSRTNREVEVHPVQRHQPAHGFST